MHAFKMNTDTECAFGNGDANANINEHLKYIETIRKYGSSGHNNDAKSLAPHHLQRAELAGWMQ